MIYQAKPIAIVTDKEDVIGELYGDYVDINGELVSNGKFYIREYYLNQDGIKQVDYRVNIEETLKIDWYYLYIIMR